MSILLLIKSNANIVNIEDCKTRTEFIAYTIKSYLINYNVTIKNCYQPINLVFDYIFFINETGFYNETSSFLKNIKLYSKYGTFSFATSNKYYTNENIMFGILKNISNSKYVYIKPPVNEDFYISRDNNNINVLFDISNELYNEQLIYISDKIREYDSVNICTINTMKMNYHDINLNINYTIDFNSYLEYINELSNGNIYILTNTCNDIYKLYEFSMCNIKIISHESFIPKYIIDELDVYTYNDINKLNWDIVFNLAQTHNIRDKLIMDNYSWTNTIYYINSKLDSHTNIINDTYNLQNDMTIKTLNINNHNKPMIITKTNIVEDDKVMDKIYEILEIKEVNQTKPKRRILLQSQVLRK